MVTNTLNKQPDNQYREQIGQMDEPGEYLAIEIERFKPDSLVGCNLYHQIHNKGKFILYKRKEIEISYNDIERLMSNNIRNLFVDAGDEKIVKDYLEDNLTHYLNDAEKPLDKKSELFYECATHRVQEVLKNPATSENVRRSQAIVENLVNFVFMEKKALNNLMQIMSYDYYTYTHSVNVCTFTVALAKFAGEERRAVLKNIGLGALLHDVGKRNIPEEITNKKGRLSDEEMDVMKKHPLYGLEIVKNMSRFPVEVEVIVVQHHEKANGKGYPFGLEENEIHRLAKMASVVDIFDALTTERSYKGAVKTFPALRIMKEKMKEGIDSYFFSSLIGLLGE